MSQSAQTAPLHRAHTKPFVIVLGNEKGGTGKSTFAMHIITSLLHQGYQVGSIDIDARQGTLSRYIENRHAYQLKENISIPMPVHQRLSHSLLNDVSQANAQDTELLEKTLSQMEGMDWIVIDTPGSATFLSQKAHSYADILITPLNDSFIDLDLLVRLESTESTNLRPSLYAEMVWNTKKVRLMRDKKNLEWIVLRNRLSGIHARNKGEMERILRLLANRIGFQFCAGFGERVIFKELFLSGLTLLDLEKIGAPFTLSHVSARQELRNLMLMIPGAHQQINGIETSPPRQQDL